MAEFALDIVAHADPSEVPEFESLPALLTKKSVAARKGLNVRKKRMKTVLIK
jgi:hypothetical protein